MSAVRRIGQVLLALVVFAGVALVAEYIYAMFVASLVVYAGVPLKPVTWVPTVGALLTAGYAARRVAS